MLTKNVLKRINGSNLSLLRYSKFFSKQSTGRAGPGTQIYREFSSKSPSIWDSTNGRIFSLATGKKDIRDLKMQNLISSGCLAAIGAGCYFTGHPYIATFFGVGAFLNFASKAHKILIYPVSFIFPHEKTQFFSDIFTFWPTATQSNFDVFYNFNLLLEKSSFNVEERLILSIEENPEDENTWLVETYKGVETWQKSEVYPSTKDYKSSLETLRNNLKGGEHSNVNYDDRVYYKTVEDFMSSRGSILNKAAELDAALLKQYPQFNQEYRLFLNRDKETTPYLLSIHWVLHQNKFNLDFEKFSEVISRNGDKFFDGQDQEVTQQVHSEAA